MQMNWIEQLWETIYIQIVLLKSVTTFYLIAIYIYIYISYMQLYLMVSPEQLWQFQASLRSMIWKNATHINYCNTYIENRMFDHLFHKINNIIKLHSNILTYLYNKQSYNEQRVIYNMILLIFTKLCNHYQIYVL